MLELGNIPHKDRIVCGNFEIEIPDPHAVVDVINKCTTPMELIHAVYLPGEMPLIHSSIMHLKHIDDTSAVAVHAAIIYTPDEDSCQKDQTKHIYDLLSKNDSMRPDTRLNCDYIETSLYEKSDTALHVTKDESGWCYAHILSFIDTSSSMRTYNSLYENLALFANLHALLSPGYKQVVRELTTITQDHPNDDEYRLWQQLLASEDQLAALGSPSMPAIDYADINLRSILDTFGPPSDDLVAASLRAAIARKRLKHSDSGDLSPISHLDLYQELNYLPQQLPRHRLPDENNHHD